VQGSEVHDELCMMLVKNMVSGCIELREFKILLTSHQRQLSSADYCVWIKMRNVEFLLELFL
jgi:hypothetical protein